MRMYSLLVLCAALLFSHSTAQAQASPKKEPSFAATGLLAFPGETAEEILFRAHTYDNGAMILASLGYLKGMHGFPQDVALSLAWSRLLATVGNVEAYTLTSFLGMDELAEVDESETLMMLCLTVKGNPLIGILQDAGIADIEGRCARLEKESAPDVMAEAAEKSRALRQRVEQAAYDALTLMRALRTRKATPADCKQLEELALVFPSRTLLFFAATTHDPASEKADPSQERLMNFVASQGTDILSGELASLFDAVPYVLPYLNSSSPVLQETVRQAHAGKPSATRMLAESYRCGVHGAPQFGELHQAWLQHAAFAGDSSSMLSLITLFLSYENTPVSWAWADILAHDRIMVADAASKKVAQQVLDTLEADMKDEDKVSAKAYQTLLLRNRTPHGKDR